MKIDVFFVENLWGKYERTRTMFNVNASFPLQEQTLNKN